MHCAVHRHGGWWYNMCTYSNLNGHYDKDNDIKGVFWRGHFCPHTHSLPFDEMKLRQK